MPKWFAQQPQSYRDEVLPPAQRARVKAGIGQGWRDIVGDAGRIVSLEHFGASADHQQLYQEFGITAEAVARAARDSTRDTFGPIRPGGEQQAPRRPQAAPATDPRDVGLTPPERQEMGGSVTAGRLEACRADRAEYRPRGPLNQSAPTAGAKVGNSRSACSSNDRCAPRLQ
ncbi:hypothetical protein AB0C07_22915 [Actinoplanes missouriensis]